MRRTDVDGWGLTLPFLALLLGQALLAATGTIPVLRGELLDPDAYMRLSRVVSLHDGGSWFDPVYPRINAPEGQVLHWTRPLDVLLLAGAAPLEPFLGFRNALHLWGVLISPLFVAGALLTVFWASAPVLSRRGQILAGFALLLQSTIIAYGSAGRPDHHGLLLFLFTLLIALVPQLVARPEHGRLAWLAAAASALGIWVSVEALAFAAVALAVMGTYWLLGTAGMARANLRYTLACALGLTVALVAERGPAAWTAVENDRLSVLHVVLFGAIAAFWLAVLVGERAGLLRSSAARLAAALLGGGLVLAGLHALFPGLSDGPTGPIDPLYREVHLNLISEVQPLVSWSDLRAGNWSQAIGRLVTFSGFVVVAVPYLLLRLVRERGRTHPLWVFAAAGLALFVPLSMCQVRWSIWPQLLVLIPYAALLDAALDRLGRSLTPRRLGVLRPLTAAVGLVWPVLLLQALPSADAAPVTASCALGPMARFLQTVDGPATIMTLPDFGPELLYRTEHTVLSIPHHRFQPGFTATYRALTAPDDATAHALLDRHGVDWILLCPNPTERAIYEHEGPSSGALYRRLLEGRGPRWLRPVELPPPLQATFMLFAVEPERKPGVDESIALAPPAGASAGATHGADRRNEQCWAWGPRTPRCVGHTRRWFAANAPAHPIRPGRGPRRTQ